MTIGVEEEEEEERKLRAVSNSILFLTQSDASYCSLIKFLATNIFLDKVWTQHPKRRLH